jgi:hypothetical protein
MRRRTGVAAPLRRPLAANTAATPLLFRSTPHRRAAHTGGMAEPPTLRDPEMARRVEQIRHKYRPPVRSRPTPD